MVACDSVGCFLAGRKIWFPADISASEAELIGVYEALLSSCNMDFTSVVVEIDAKVVCDEINEKKIGDSTFGSYVSACIDLCLLFLDVILILFVGKPIVWLMLLLGSLDYMRVPIRGLSLRTLWTVFSTIFVLIANK
ncbi:hypothetical protein ACS0TY_014946 [Phlomoides rotata]